MLSGDCRDGFGFTAASEIAGFYTEFCEILQLETTRKCRFNSDITLRTLFRRTR